MRRFVFVEGGSLPIGEPASSRKFWEIARSDADVTVRFGKIGTEG